MHTVTRLLRDGCVTKRLYLSTDAQAAPLRSQPTVAQVWRMPLLACCILSLSLFARSHTHTMTEQLIFATSPSSCERRGEEVRRRAATTQLQRGTEIQAFLPVRFVASPCSCLRRQPYITDSLAKKRLVRICAPAWSPGGWCAALCRSQSVRIAAHLCPVTSLRR